MNKRRALSLAVRSMLLALVLAFVWVLLNGIGGVQQTDGHESNHQFGDLLIGQTALRRADNHRVWATRLSAEQKIQAISLSDFVSTLHGGCDLEEEFCVLVSATSRDGIDVQFTDKAPAQLPSDYPWFGGYVDPTNGAVYDRLGRPYKLAKQSEASLVVMDNE